MAFHSGPRYSQYGVPVTNGLVLALDASNFVSYPETGTTWYDISGNGYNGTLINGPTYNTAYAGSIVFDGSNDYSSHGYISQLYNTKTITYNLWLKLNILGGNQIVIGNENQDGTIGFGIRKRAGGEYWISPGVGLPNILNITPNVDISKPHMITALTDGTNGRFYINGSLIGSSSYSTTYTSQTAFYIGAGNSVSGPGTEPFGGNVYNVQVYNRALSDQEIVQNYNALKPRFGL